MKISKYLLLSTTILGLVNPLVVLADQNATTPSVNSKQSSENKKESDLKNDSSNQIINTNVKSSTSNFNRNKTASTGQEITYGAVTLTLDDNGVLTIPDGVSPRGTTDYLSRALDDAGVLEQVKTVKFLGGINFQNMGERADTLTNGLTNVESIEGLEKSDFSKQTNFTAMFGANHHLKSIDLSGIDTSSATNMYGMFGGTDDLTSLNLNKLNTSNVTRMDDMFDGSGIQTLDMSGMDLGQVDTMSYMFSESKLQKFDFTSLNLPNLTNMAFMFSQATDLTDVNLGSGFGAHKLEMLSALFQNTAIQQLDASKLDTSNVTSMAWMFQNMPKLTDLNVNGLDTSKVKLMNQMFTYDASLEKLDLSSFDTSQIEELDMGTDGGMNYMFSKMTNLKSLTLGPKFVFQKETATAGIGSQHTDPNYAWHNQGDNGLPKDKHMWSSDDFINNYDGKQDADTYVWQPNAVKAADVTAKYVDGNGKEIAKSEVQSGNIGDKYKTEQKKIAGYTFKEVQGNAAGDFTDQA
nr:BspA family leucine-rich repeat surface protein [Weissella coleopterorum]